MTPDQLRLTPDAATRVVTREITIGAPVEAVWRALTDAEELTRWFPPHARVEPDVGGRVWRAWQSGEEIEERIERWEPNRHFRTIGLTGGWQGITTDYHLASDRGSTILRVVSSGFGADADWDALYEAFGGGWDFELRGLRHYLERHRGLRRVVALARGSRPTGAAESWRCLTSPGGWMGEKGLAGTEAGAPYDVVIASGERLSGTVLLLHAPHQFAATVDEINNAYLRIDTRCIGESGTPWIWLSTYGVPPARVRQIEHGWQRTLDSALATHGR